MAHGAGWVGPVLFHALAHGQLLDGPIVFQRWNIRRRRWRGRTQELLQHPLAADRRRRPVGIGGHRQNAALSEQAVPVRVLQLDAAELDAVNALDPVVLGQALIQEGVVRTQQVGDAPIVPHLTFDQELGLFRKGMAQVLVEIRIGRRVRRYPRDVAQEQPLAGEVLHQRLRAWIGQHALDLRLQDGRVGQAPALGNGEQLVVGNAAPQEERQARRQLDVADLIDAARVSRPADRVPRGTGSRATPGSSATPASRPPRSRRSVRPFCRARAVASCRCR